MRHIVDILIEERATKLMKNPRIWSFVQSRLYPYLKYQEAKELIDSLPAIAWMAYSIHGNETSGADAALGIIYHLIANHNISQE